MNKKAMETPLSETSVSLNLEMIQRRCSELLDKPDALMELTLEESANEDLGASDPYNRHRS